MTRGIASEMKYSDFAQRMPQTVGVQELPASKALAAATAARRILVRGGQVRNNLDVAMSPVGATIHSV